MTEMQSLARTQTCDTRKLKQTFRPSKLWAAIANQGLGVTLYSKKPLESTLAPRVIKLERDAVRRPRRVRCVQNP